MNNKITVIDNFFNLDQLKRCLDIVDNLKWVFGARSRFEEGYKFWSSELMSKKWLMKTTMDRLHMENGLKLRFSVCRAEANGQTYGQDGIFHIDNKKEDHYTLLIYMSDTDGHTQFKIDGQLVNIEPLKNRAVIFKSDILHRGLAPSRDSDDLRVSLAFKLCEIKS
jgi:hypothetical protein